MADLPGQSFWADVLLEAISEPALLLGPEATVLAANRRLFRHLGLSRPQFEELRQGPALAFLRLAFEPETASRIFSWMRDPGTVPELATPKAFQGAGEALVWRSEELEIPSVGICRLIRLGDPNVTEKSVIERLESEKAVVDRVLQQLPFGVIVIEAPSGKFLMRNGAMTRFSEGMYPNPESTQDYDQYGVFREDGTRYQTHEFPTVRGFRTGEVVEGELMEVRLVTGRRRWVSVYTSPIQNEEGKMVAGVAAVLDVSEQVRLRKGVEFLAEVGTRLAKVRDFDRILKEISRTTTSYFEGWCVVHTPNDTGWMMPVSIAHSDPQKEDLVRRSQGRNPNHGAPGTPGPATVFETGEALFIQEVQEEDLRRFAHDDEHLAVLQQLGLRGVVVLPLDSVEMRHGTLTICSAHRRFEDADLLFARELSARFALALENAKLFEDLKGAVRLRDELISLSSHEIRTPLTSLRLLMELIESLLQSPDRLPGGLDRLMGICRNARAQVDQTTGLLDLLLDLSRLDSGKFELACTPINMADVIRDAVEMIEPQFRDAGVQLTVSLADDCPVSVEAVRMRQALVNLLSNALKYGAGRPVEVILQKDSVDSLVRTAVVDHGPGVSQEDRERIFERFDRGLRETSGKGHGLGLFISRAIVRAHGGKLVHCGTPSGGATFLIELPVRDS